MEQPQYNFSTYSKIIVRKFGLEIKTRLWDYTTSEWRLPLPVLLAVFKQWTNWYRSYFGNEKVAWFKIEISESTGAVGRAADSAGAKVTGINLTMEINCFYFKRKDFRSFVRLWTDQKSSSTGASSRSVSDDCAAFLAIIPRLTSHSVSWFLHKTCYSVVFDLCLQLTRLRSADC